MTATGRDEDGKSVPLYVVTGGHADRAGARRRSLALDLVTLVVANSGPGPGMPPERAALLRVCRRPLSVAEISAHLGLPFSAVVVLLLDLYSDGHVEIKESRTEQRRTAADPDLATLKALIDGLQRL
ncbi:DUF742 domain-containing protein [Streptomyces litchfieldiae]|uniref:DUF742 domain-containing protein n=1 Tax=Streptomyces litchfieldiae TaxID=3075543 RepID=A0ABU2MSU7_9ACTN|nr:DUF742 domain-containing protein [Streptomyces sp. DSM 44938]MDT0344605.1 DUF742 domain-containing protein [Streptomyces sp. DSM 44938]